MTKVLYFPSRTLLMLTSSVTGILNGTEDPARTLALCDAMMAEIGAVKDAEGNWQLPESEGESHG